MALLMAAERPWVVTRTWAALFALAILVVLGWGTHALLARRRTPVNEMAAGGEDDDEGEEVAVERQVARRRQGIKSLVMGADGRASTSKTQAVLWTFAVFYALVFLLVWGRSTNCGDDALREHGACQEATGARVAFDAVVEGELQEEYYVLLGFPLVVAVAAKAITTAKVQDRTVVKEDIAPDQGGVLQGLSELVSNDRGESDLLDFQYLAFNLLTLAYFFAQFLTEPGAGLPDVPPTLLALSGASTAVYTAKKALEGGPRPAEEPSR
jgi:hypothetical protein